MWALPPGAPRALLRFAPPSRLAASRPLGAVTIASAAAELRSSDADSARGAGRWLVKPRPAGWASLPSSPAVARR